MSTSLAAALLSLVVVFNGLAPAAGLPPSVSRPALRESHAAEPLFAAQDRPTPEVVRLASGSRFKRELKDGESHLYELEAKAGQFWRVLAEQQNLDVTVFVFDAGGTQAAAADNPNGRFGQESASFVAAAGGLYRVEVRGVKKYSAPGSYELSVELRETPTREDLRRVEAEKLLAEATTLRREGKPESLLRALDKYNSAAAIWRELREGGREGWTTLAAGWTQYALGKEQKARDLYQQALKLHQAAGEQRGVAAATYETAASYARQKDRGKALDWYDKALTLYETLGDDVRRATVLNSIGTLYGNWNEERRAMGFYQRAWELRRAIGDPTAGVSLRNVASVNYALGNKETATTLYLQTLPLLRDAGDRYWEARVLRALGLLSWERKDYQKALEYYTQALEVFEALRDSASTAAVYSDLGDVLLALERKGEASDYYRKGLQAAQDANDKVQADRARNALDDFQPEGADEEATAAKVTRLSHGQTVEAEFEGDEVQAYSLELRAGNAVEAAALQRGSNVSLRLLDPAGRERSEVDFVSTPDSPVPEPLHFVADADGTYLVEVRRLDEQTPARYTLTVAVKAAATSADRTRVRAEAALAECLRLKNEETRATREEAIVKCRASLPLWRELNDAAWEARALNHVGNILCDLGRAAEALPVYRDTLALRRAAGDRLGEGFTLVNIGRIHKKLGERELAIELFQQALAAFRDAHDAGEAADALLWISDVYLDSKEADKRGDYCRQAAAVAHEGGSAIREGRALRCLGGIDALAGRTHQAEENYTAAVVQLQRAKDWTFLARVHLSLGQLRAARGDDAAESSIRESLELAQMHALDSEAARAHEALGDLYLKRGDAVEALNSHRQALRLWNGLGYKNEADRALARVSELSARVPAAAGAQSPTQDRPQLSTQIGHSSTVREVKYSPDGKLLASAGEDDVIRIWDVATGQELRTLVGHTNTVTSLAYNPADGLLASASDDSTIRVWDVETGRELPPFVGHNNALFSIAFSPDGKTLASSSAKEDFRVWDVQTRKLKYSVSAHDGMVFQVAFNRDGTLLASAGADKTVKVWDAATGSPVKTLNGPGRMTSVAFSPDGRLLAAGCQDKKIHLWELDGWREVGELKDHTGVVMSVAFDPDGGRLLSSGKDGAVKLWDVRSGDVLHTYSSQAEVVWNAAFAKDGKSFATANDDETVRLWNVDSEAATRTLGGRQTVSSSVAYSDDGHWLAQAVGSQIVLWDLRDGTSVGVFRGHRGQVVSLAFSHDARLLASGSSDRTAKLWDVSTMKAVQNLTRHTKEVQGVAFSPDGRTLVTVSDDKRIKLWNVADGSEKKSLLAESEVQAVAYSPDGRWFATGSVDNTFSLWDSNTYARWRSPEAANSITTITFSSDKKTLAVGDGDGIVRLWDIASRSVAHTCTGHIGILNSMSFSPDGRTLATGGDDKTVMLWATESGRKLGTLVGHTSNVQEVAFSPDGRTLASSGYDGSTRLWDPDSGEVRATLVVTDQTGNWLVVARNGLFDGSTPAWSQILWRFSPRLYDVKPVEVFFNEFFRPGLLADVAKGRVPAVPREIQNIDRRQPTVSIVTAGRSPEEGAAAADRSVAVSVDVAEVPPGEGYAGVGGGVRDVRLFRNGLLVMVWRGDALDGSSGCRPLGNGRARCEARVSVVAGANRLTAYAFNRHNVKSVDAEAVLDGGADSSRPSTLYILAVGINHYKNHEFDLKYAVPDADDFGAELNLKQKGLSQFRRREVIPLYDEKASRGGIVSALNSLKDRVQPEDTVVIYFAGHGVAYDNQFVLVPYDLGYAGRREDLDEKGLKVIREHGISDRDLEAILEGLNAGRLLMVIDACQSGQALKSEEWRQGPMNSKGLAQLAYEKGMYVLTASQSFQSAHGSGKFNHGYLTYALVEEGLKGLAADSSPADGRVMLREWFDYATSRVPKIRQDATERRELVHTGGRRSALDPRDAQHPRVFYRRGLEATPFVVAEGASSAASPRAGTARDGGASP